MDGDPGETLVLRSDPVALLESSPIFRGLDRDDARRRSPRARLDLRCRAARRCSTRDEPSDAMYLVIAGCLGAYSSGEPPQLLQRIAAGEIGRRDGAVVGPRAHRDGARAARQRPRAAAARVLRPGDRAAPGARCSGSRSCWSQRLEPIAGRHDARRRAAHLTRCCRRASRSTSAASRPSWSRRSSRIGRTELVWSVRGADHTQRLVPPRRERERLRRLRRRPGADRPGRKLCLRQADAILLVARAESEARPWPVSLGDIGGSSAATRSELILLHDRARHERCRRALARGSAGRAAPPRRAAPPTSRGSRAY